MKERTEHAVEFLVFIFEHCKLFTMPVKWQAMYKRGLQMWDAFKIG